MSKSEYLLELIKNEWADIHHSRNQEWTSLVIIGGVFYAFFNVSEKDVQQTIALFGFIACMLSIMMLYRHWKLFRKKIYLITLLEKEIGICLEFYKNEKEDRKVKKITVQSILMQFYFLLGSSLAGGFVWCKFENSIIFWVTSLAVFIIGIILCFYIFPKQIDEKARLVRVKLLENFDAKFKILEFKEDSNDKKS